MHSQERYPEKKSNFKKLKDTNSKSKVLLWIWSFWVLIGNFVVFFFQMKQDFLAIFNFHFEIQLDEVN